MTLEIRWFGQSAFRLSAGSQAVMIDPFGRLTPRPGADLRFDYPPIPAQPADLLLITHEHQDHNHAQAVSGTPQVIRSTAGSFDTPIGRVVAIASEHDRLAGTQRGPNTIFVFTLGGFRIAHFGDFGQSALRPEQLEALGQVDLAFLPVGGGPTIDGQMAAALSRQIGASWVVPMHYRTAAVNFLEPVDAFLAAMPHQHPAQSLASLDAPAAEAPTALVLAPPA